jgi:NAD(P)-dependent dehydrogenase (short-subunit alcohol dehydrogenase family)
MASEESPSAVARVVLITGCSSGIGAATALHLQREGWQVYATARRSETLEALAQAGCRVLALDVTDEASMQAAVERVHAEAGGIGVLINNAGYSQSGAIEDVPMASVRRQFETNVFGLLRLTQLVLPDMRARRQGRIVNIGSMGGRLTFPGGGIYHATKHALEAVTDALRFEVKGFGIDVILIQPGLIRTAFTSTVSKHLAPVHRDRGPYAHFTREVERITRESYVQGLVARWGGTAEDVAEVIATALRAREPRARYKVTASAWLFMTLRAVVSDAVWDSLLARTYPRPGAPADPQGR